jgi:hypothetical protein
LGNVFDVVVSEVFRYNSIHDALLFQFAKRESAVVHGSS